MHTHKVRRMEGGKRRKGEGQDRKIETCITRHTRS